jgi:ribosomal-protein-alanine N-acetyltransferase
MKSLPLETERLILREFREEDAQALFEMESNPLVLKYLFKEPLRKLEEIYPIIEKVQRQYLENGYGRLIMIEKESGKLMGWTGLKLETQETNGFRNYIDLGYRMKPEFLGKDFATESALASINYGFEVLKAKSIYGAAHVENIASNKVLQNVGLSFVNCFVYEGKKHKLV